MSGRARGGRPWWLAVALMIGAGCGIEPDEVARPVDDAPAELFEVPTTESIPDPPEDADYDLTLMFINASDRRVPITRTVEVPPTNQDVLAGLAAQPSEEELADHPDISTRLLAGLVLRDGGVEEGQLRVDVEGTELRQASIDSPERVRLIYGQIVCSIVGLDNGVETVVLVDDEGAINFPSEAAIVESAGAGPADFNDCLTAAELAAIEAEPEEEDDGSTTTEGPS